MTWLVQIPLAAASLLAGTGIAYMVGTRSVIAKSPQRFSSTDSRVARHGIYLEAPGAHTQNLERAPFRKVGRPKWPFVR